MEKDAKTDIKIDVKINAKTDTALPTMTKIHLLVRERRRHRLAFRALRARVELMLSFKGIMFMPIVFYSASVIFQHSTGIYDTHTYPLTLLSTLAQRFDALEDPFLTAVLVMISLVGPIVLVEQWQRAEGRRTAFSRLCPFSYLRSVCQQVPQEEPGNTPLLPPVDHSDVDLEAHPRPSIRSSKMPYPRLMVVASVVVWTLLMGMTTKLRMNERVVNTIAPESGVLSFPREWDDPNDFGPNPPILSPYPVQYWETTPPLMPRPTYYPYQDEQYWENIPPRIPPMPQPTDYRDDGASPSRPTQTSYLNDPLPPANPAINSYPPQHTVTRTWAPYPQETWSRYVPDQDQYYTHSTTNPWQPRTTWAPYPQATWRVVEPSYMSGYEDYGRTPRETLKAKPTWDPSPPRDIPRPACRVPRYEYQAQQWIDPQPTPTGVSGAPMIPSRDVPWPVMTPDVLQKNVEAAMEDEYLLSLDYDMDKKPIPYIDQSMSEPWLEDEYEDRDCNSQVASNGSDYYNGSDTYYDPYDTEVSEPWLCDAYDPYGGCIQFLGQEEIDLRDGYSAKKGIFENWLGYLRGESDLTLYMFRYIHGCSLMLIAMVFTMGLSTAGLYRLKCMSDRLAAFSVWQELSDKERERLWNELFPESSDASSSTKDLLDDGHQEEVDDDQDQDNDYDYDFDENLDEDAERERLLRAAPRAPWEYVAHLILNGVQLWILASAHWDMDPIYFMGVNFAALILSVVCLPSLNIQM